MQNSSFERVSGCNGAPSRRTLRPALTRYTGGVMADDACGRFVAEFVVGGVRRRSLHLRSRPALARRERRSTGVSGPHGSPEITGCALDRKGGHPLRVSETNVPTRCSPSQLAAVGKPGLIGDGGALRQPRGRRTLRE